MNDKNKQLKNVEILNVNRELIQKEKPNGFKIEKANLLMFVKKLPGNIYKLLVLFLATVADFVPNFVSKVPVVGYAVDALRAYADQYVAQAGSDIFFDKVICPLMGIEVDMTSPKYALPYVQYTHHEGKYFQISMAIKTIAQFVMEHPGLVLAGGAAVVGLAYKLISIIFKTIGRKMKFNRMNKKQREIYLLLKDVLKKSGKIKKADNGEILVKDLNITYDIINYLGEYADMLDRIEDILLTLRSAIERKDIEAYEKCRIDLENSVFSFDESHDNILNKEMHLVENTKK